MDNSLRKVVELQVRRVRRRLRLQSVLQSAALTMAVSLFASAIWLALYPLVLAEADPAWRWAVPIAVAGAVICVASTNRAMPKSPRRA